MTKRSRTMTPQKFRETGSQMDEEYNFRLMESKAQRKKVQEDARLLQNRIQLLELEEKKAMKKIEETQKKAQEIQDLKRRNFEMQLRKEEMARKRQEEIEHRNQQNRMLRERIEHNTQYSRAMHMSKVRNEADQAKQIIRDTKGQASSVNNEAYSKSMMLVQEIKRGKMELEAKKRFNQEKIRGEARKEYENKIKSELQIKQTTESQITALERKEMDLIERLKNTQIKQKEVFDVLEKAITTFPTKKDV